MREIKLTVKGGALSPFFAVNFDRFETIGTIKNDYITN